MCLVSVVHDWGNDEAQKLIWPHWLEPQITGPAPVPPAFPLSDMVLTVQTPPTLQQRKEQLQKMKVWLSAFKELLKAAEVFDTKTEQPNCEDPLKMAWVKQMEERITAMEMKLAEAELSQLEAIHEHAAPKL